MSALSDEPEKLKIVHTYGAGLHAREIAPDVNDPKWQKGQIDDFVEFAVLAEELGFDGLTVTEHHTPQMVCPSPNLLLTAAAMRTSKIRLGTAVTVLPLHHPMRAAEEAGTLDLISGGRFELGIGRGSPREHFVATGRGELPADEGHRAWREAAELLDLMLTETDVTYQGEFFQVDNPTTIATRPMQTPLPVWVGGSSQETMRLAARHGWNVMRNKGSNAEHRAAMDDYIRHAAEYGHTKTAANFMVERFISTGHTQAEIDDRLERFTAAFRRFVTLYEANGRQLNFNDGEQAMDQKKGRPGLVTAGTPDQVTAELVQTLEESGARRLLIECFSVEESQLFAKEIMPALREHFDAKLAEGAA